MSYELKIPNLRNVRLSFWNPSPNLSLFWG